MTSHNVEKQAPSLRAWVSDTQMAEIFSVSRSTIWRWLEAGRLPKPVKLSPGCTRWKLSEVEQFLEEGSQ